MILDNHDVFGGHAKRNEFWYGENMLLSQGGTINIEAITLNRWPHGYAYGQNPDAAANAMTESAIGQAYRAVTDLTKV